MSQAPAELRKVIGRKDVLALAFGAMVGWGWVVLSGEMIARGGTIGSALAFIVGAAMVLLVGLTYAELVSAMSRAGGELSFTFVGLGARAAWLCGWILTLAYLSVCAFEAVALPTVVGYLSPVTETGFMYSLAGWDVHLVWVLVGVAGSIGIGVVNYFGIRFASFVQWTAAGAMFLVGMALFIPGNVVGETANLAPFFTDWGGFFAVVLMTPFLFLGFDVIPQVAEEINVPFRVIGRLLVVSILIAMGWYVLVQWTVGLTLGAEGRAAGELVTADAMTAVYGSAWGGRVLVIGGMLGIVTSWNAFFLGATRLLFAMSRGGMLPPVFSRLHPRHESPVAAILLVTAVSVAAPFFGRPALVWFVDAGSFAAVTAYFLVTVSFLRIRRKHPELERPYRVPAGGVVGGLAVASTLFFLILYLPGSPTALGLLEWLIVGGWILLGLCLGAIIKGPATPAERRHQADRILGRFSEMIYGPRPEAEEAAPDAGSDTKRPLRSTPPSL